MSEKFEQQRNPEEKKEKTLVIQQNLDEGQNSKPEEIKKGVEFLDADFFNNLNLAVQLAKELLGSDQKNFRIKEVELQPKIDSLVQYLGREIELHIETNEQLSDLIDQILIQCTPDNILRQDSGIVKENGNIALIDKSRLGHNNSLRYIWINIYNMVFEDRGWDQTALIDKKFHYVWVDMTNNVWLKMRSRFSEDKVWDSLRERLTDGCNTLQMYLDSYYMVSFGDEGSEPFVTVKEYQRYLQIVREVITEKPELEKKILKWLDISDRARRDLMRESASAELVLYLENRAKQIEDQKKPEHLL